MNTEDIKTQFVGIFTDIIEIYDKTSKFGTKDIDTLTINVVASKKNVLLKRLYDLEEDIGKLKVLISKAILQSAIEPKEEMDADPGQVEVKEEKPKKTKPKTSKSAEKEKEQDPSNVTTVITAPLPIPVVDTPIQDKKVKKVKVSKEEEEVSPKEELKSKNTKKKDTDTTVKEEVKEKNVKTKKTPEKVEELEVTIVDDDDLKQDTNSDDSQQPLHLRRKKIPKQIKTLVWNEYIGHDIMTNKCLCCKKEKIDVRNFHCGHIIAESKGGDLTIKNLRPICAPCNLSMGTMSMNEFTKTFFGWEV